MVLIKALGDYFIRLGLASFLLGLPITMLVFPDGFVLTYPRILATVYLGIHVVFIFHMTKDKVKPWIEKSMGFFLKIKKNH